MSVKKSKEMNFVFQDAAGELRSVVVRVEHRQEEGEDRVSVALTSDGVPLEVRSFLHPPRRTIKP